MQQYLIPHRTGDDRLLIPGWAGELSDPEVDSYKNVYACHDGCLGNGESLTGAIANKAYARWPCRGLLNRQKR